MDLSPKLAIVVLVVALASTACAQSPAREHAEPAPTQPSDPFTATDAPPTTERFPEPLRAAERLPEPVRIADLPITEPEPTASPTHAQTIEQRALEAGTVGEDVRRVERRLLDLGYWLPDVDSTFDEATRQAVFALQKAAGIPANGIVDTDDRQALADGIRPRPRSSSGDLVEIDKERQLLLVVRSGEVTWTFNTSTGTDELYRHPDGYTARAHTREGEWTIGRQIDGLRRSKLGRLWRPKYFHRGLAIHGSGHVPPVPASHGCVRVSNVAMNEIWEQDLAPVGSRVWVY